MELALARCQGAAVSLRIFRRNLRRWPTPRQGDLLCGRQRGPIRRRLGASPGLHRAQEVDLHQDQHARQEEHRGREHGDRPPFGA